MKLDIAIATSKGVLKMATLKMHLEKLDMEKVGQRFWVLYQKRYQGCMGAYQMHQIV